MNLYDFVIGKIKREEAVPMEEAGSVNYSDILDGYIITIGENDYYLPEMPKEEPVPLMRIQK